MTAAQKLNLVSVDDYLSIPSLSAYLLVETDRPRVVVYRRGDDGAFAAEVYEDRDATIRFADVDLALAELYARVTFPPITG